MPKNTSKISKYVLSVIRRQKKYNKKIEKQCASNRKPYFSYKSFYPK